MRLKSVTLNNFRCFEHLHIDLHPRLTVFVGANGVGKTALMDGIATAFTPMLSYLSSANQRLKGRGIKDSDFRIIQKFNSTNPQTSKIADYTQIIAETHEGLQWDYSKQSRKWPGSPFKKIGEKLLREYLDDVMVKYQADVSVLTPVVAYYGSGRGNIQIPDRLPPQKEGGRHPTSALLNALDAKNDFREMLAWFEEEESAELRVNRGRTLENLLPFASLHTVRSVITSLLGGAYEDPHFNEKYQFVLRRGSDNAELSVSQLSQGYQSMLALAMDFSRRLSIANPYFGIYYSDDRMNILDEEIHKLARLGKNIYSLDQLQLPTTDIHRAPAIMLIDEIDLHLHPSWQQRVLDDLMRTFPLTQFIVTTHSPQVLTSVDAACIRKLEQHTDPDTGVVRTVLSTVTQQTRGVASADVLAEIMGVDPIPDVPEARDLSAYHGLIQQNLHESDDGQALRHKLDAHFGPDHPVMLDCNRMIRLQAFKQKLPLAAARSA